MEKKEQQSMDKRHRSPKTPIWLIFDHEVGPYTRILAGFKPMEWEASNIPLNVLKEDVENQLTLLLAGEEYLGENHIGEPLYGDLLDRLGKITQYRDENKEKFITALKNKMEELFPNKR